MSTGMKQKVSFARTIIHDPPVLIFDEPTSGLDVLVARNVIDTVSQLRDAGKSIIYSTHIMTEVEKLCDRIAIIHKGKILAMGSRQELYETHSQENMEGLFFQLIDQYDDESAAAEVS
jgi:sodium transport system ATP-binding protein